MKKIIITLAVLFCFFILKADAYQIEADIKTKRIPAGTKLELEMANNVLSSHVNSGDMFNAYLTKDISSGSYMILPKGTMVRGNISSVNPSKRLSRSAVLYLNFDHIVALDGSHLPISAGLSGVYTLDEKGGIKGGGNYGAAIKENWDKSGKMIKKATNWGITSGEDLFTGGKYLVTPFSAIGGAIAGTGYFIGSSVADLFKKGNEVYIKQGEKFNIMLLEPLDVPVSE